MKETKFHCTSSMSFNLAMRKRFTRIPKKNLLVAQLPCPSFGFANVIM